MIRESMQMTGTIGQSPNDDTVTRKLYKDSRASLMYMETAPEKTTSSSKNNDTKHMVSVIERFIKENSGEYKRKSIWSNFSDIMTLKEFDIIIEDLHRSGKIAIDKENKIGWIWNPKLTKKYRNRTGLAFR
jgi:hypothetical protein